MGFLDFSGLTRFKQHLDTLLSGKLSTSLKGAANGLAELNDSGKVPSSQLPSYVDDVLEFSTYYDFPLEGESGKIYVDLETNISYRWGGTAYVKIASDLALGETSSTAYRGDRGASAYTHAVTNKGSAFANGLYKITTNEEGHVTAATAVQTDDITALGIATKDQDAVEGNFAAFDDEGNPVDSGHKHSDYITSHQDISGKLDKTYETLSSFNSKASLGTILAGVITNMPANSKTLVKADCETGFDIFATQTSYFFEISKGSSNSYASILIGTIGGHWLYSGRISGETFDFKTFKTTQLAVSDPEADGTGTTFIDSISQDANGVITPHKKTVQTMSASSVSDSGSGGLVPAPAAGKQTSFLRGDATWAIPTDTTYADFTGATASTDGTSGLVPEPTSGKQSLFLRGDATWAVPTNTKNTAGATDSSDKLFIIGATSQDNNPQTYSHDTAYVGTDGCLYSGGVKVLTAHQNISGKLDKTYETLDGFSSEEALLTMLTGVITEMPASSRKLVRAACTTSFGKFYANNSYFFEISKGGSDTYATVAIAPIAGAWAYHYLKSGDTWTFEEFKKTQTAVSDPTADGTGVTFIDSVSQNTQGVISPHKKTVRTFGAASASANGTTGLVPAPGSGKQSLFLRGDATWATPTNTTYADFTGATSSTAGAHGLVPAPASGKQNSFLRGDKTWAVPTNTTYATMGAASASANGSSGLVPAPGSGKQGMFLRGDATWAAPTNTTYADFTAATSAAAGAHGLVPAPGSGKQNSFLRGDKTWAIPTNTTYANASTTVAGLVSTGAQTFAGTKNFESYVRSYSGLTTLDLTAANNGVTGDTETLTFRVIDKNAAYGSALGLFATAGGTIGSEIIARNIKADGTTSVYNRLRVLIDKTGTATYYVSSPANFRSAIGVNTMGAASASTNGSTGLVPAPGSGKQGMFLRGDATWATPTNTTYADFTGATSAAAGAHGLVPAPGSGKQASFLRGDKTWAVPTNTTYANASTTVAGLVSTGSQTFAGAKTFQDASVSISFPDVDLTKSNNGISSGTVERNFVTRDSNGYSMAIHGCVANSDGTVLASLGTRNHTGSAQTSWKGITVVQDKAGVVTYSVTTPANFRSAIGVNAMGAASASANGSAGLVPAPGSGKQGMFLRGDATWATPTNTTYADFTGATSAAAGAHGLVPAPGSGKQASFLRGDKTWSVPTDTKNTAGSTNSSKKLFLIGAESQAANPQTYSQDTAYVGTDGCLYSGGTKVLTAHQDISGKKNTQSTVSDPAADGTSATFIATISQNAQGVITPTKKTVRTMGGASASANGSTGLVPAPGSGKQGSFLMGNGTWATPTNTTYADFTAATASAAGAHGLVPAPGSGKQASFLRGDKTWAVPTNTTYAVMGAATASANGTSGLVPAPGSGKQASFLRGDKTWAVPTNTTYADFTGATSAAAGAHGLVPAPASGKQATFLRGDKTWSAPTWDNVTGKPSTFAPSSHNHDSLVRRTSLTKGTKPGSTTYYGANTVYETGSGTASGNRLTWIGGYVDTSGRNVYEIGAYRFASGSTSSNYFAVGVNFDGTAYYSVTNPGVFRTAIGISGISYDTNGGLMINGPGSSYPNEGGQITLNAPTGYSKYKVALDAFQNLFRVLGGTSTTQKFYVNCDSGAHSDYAEEREASSHEKGRVYRETNECILVKANERLIPGCSVCSDTFGAVIPGLSEKDNIPFAVAGRALVYPYQDRNNYQAGMAVCSAPNGTVDIMTREEIKEYPDCILGYVAGIPKEETWPKENVPLDGRIWIRLS